MGSSHSTSGRANASAGATAEYMTAAGDGSHAGALRRASHTSEPATNENSYPKSKSCKRASANLMRRGSLKMKATIKLPCKQPPKPRTIITKMIGTASGGGGPEPKNGRISVSASGEPKSSVQTNSSTRHRHKSNQNKSVVVIAPVARPPDARERQLIHEQRRNSLKNGDVFIYPPIYRRLNECHRCSRDNKICNCNEIILEHSSNQDRSSIGPRGDGASTAAGSPSTEVKTGDSRENIDKSAISSRAAAAILRSQPMSTNSFSADSDRSASSDVDSLDVTRSRSSGSGRLPPMQQLSNRRFSPPSRDHKQEQAHGSCRQLLLPPPVPPRTNPSGASAASKQQGNDAARSQDQQREEVLQETEDCTNKLAAQYGANARARMRSPSPQSSAAGSSSSSAEVQKYSLQRKMGPTSTSIHDGTFRSGPVRSGRGISKVCDSGVGSESGSEGGSFDDRNSSEKTRVRQALALNLDDGNQDVDADDNECETLSSSGGVEMGDVLRPPEQSTGALNEQLDRAAESPSSATEITAIKVQGSPISGANTCSPSIKTPIDRLLGRQDSTKSELVTTTSDQNNNELTPRSCSNLGSEQLTSSLQSGDSIGTTSTSVCVGGSRAQLGGCGRVDAQPACALGSTDGRGSAQTRVIPIQSVTTRRRNLASKSGRQAIHEDYDADQFAPANRRHLTTIETGPADELVIIPTEQSLIGRVAAATPVTSDIHEFGPISSVGDYSGNVQINTREGLIAVPIGLSLSSLDANIRNTNAGSTDDDGGCSHGVGISGVGISGDAATSAAQEPASTMEAIRALASADGPDEPMTMTATLITAPNAIRLPHEELLETPQRSIFDGASKDEILEYLEDARERVPEVLIAADDVMVIGENELIVVNQLEPNLPATPISIVEPDGPVDVGAVISAGSAGGCQTASDSRRDTCSSDNDDIAKWPGTLFESNCDSFDVVNSNQDASLNQSLCSSVNTSGQLKNFSFRTETTIDSLEEHVAMGENFNEVSIGGSPAASEHHHHKQQQLCQQLQQQHQQLIRQYQRSSLRRQLVKDLSTSSNASNKSLSEASNTSGAARLPFSAIQRAPIYAGRRNSTSGGTSALDRDRMLQMMRVGRDSLSSSSSSPPSSTSPSSSNSSNRTSGECSAASNFYASSSLSSSSPFIALTRASPNSPAFGRSPTPASNYSNAQLLVSTGSSKESSQNQYRRGQLSATLTATQGVAILKDQLAANGDSPGEQQRDQPLAAASSPSSRVDLFDSVLGGPAGGADINGRSHRNYPQIPEFEPQPAGDPIGVDGASRGQLAKNDKFTLEQSKDIVNLNNCLDLLENEAKLLASSQAQDVAGRAAASNLITAISDSRQTISAALFSAPRKTPAQMSGSYGNNMMVAKSAHGHHATITRLTNYFISRQVPLDSLGEVAVEFQCLDCDQFIYADQAILMRKANEMRQFRANDAHFELGSLDRSKPLSSEQLDRAYIAAMNGLPLCKSCDKKRTERKEIISEFVETELKYGRDLKIIHDEFYRPMQIAGLLSKDQINGIFLNLEELIMAHCRFADRLGTAISEARSLGDQDYNTVNIGKIFVESAEMLHTFESYCIRQGSAACLLARLAKEKELLRIFLRVSQMENTLLRRMNLAAFLMVPVQRVTKYPLLLNRLHKVTAYHHKDREALRDAQLKVELHLEHINQQTKGFGASNKIWRRISSLSAPISAHRRGVINAEDIGYMKLRKTAMDMLKWNRDETQFIHSGKLSFSPLNEHLTKQKMKPLRYISAHALLIVLGKPNWKYRPDLVKSSLDNKLMIPTPDGNGIKEAALLLFREKNNRYVPCREPLFLTNCVLSNDCSQYNSECPPQTSASSTGSSSMANSKTTNQSVGGSTGGSTTSNSPAASSNNTTAQSTGSTYTNISASNGTARRSISGSGDSRDLILASGHGSGASIGDHCANAPSEQFRATSAELASSNSSSADSSSVQLVASVGGAQSPANSRGSVTNAGGRDTTSSSVDGRLTGDNVSMTSLKSLPEDQVSSMNTATSSPPVQAPRSFSLASALPRGPIITGATGPAAHLNKSAGSASSNPTILNQLMTKVNSYHLKQSAGSASKVSLNSSVDASTRHRVGSPTAHSGKDLGGKPSIAHKDGSPVDSIVVNNHSRSASLSQTSASLGPLAEVQQQYYNHHYFHNHHQPYGDYEESFEIHERISKESMLLRADTTPKTRYWLQMLRYHAKDLGQWRSRRNALSNIMVMRHETSSSVSARATSDCSLKMDTIDAKNE